MVVAPAGPEAVREVLDDPPVRPTAFERLEDLVEALDAPLGAGERPVLLQAWSGGKHDVGVAARLGEEDVLHDEEIELRERSTDVVRVRVDDAHLLAEQIE